MAGAGRMTIEEVVWDVMVREYGDVLRAALEAVCAQLMESEVTELIGAGLGERRPDDRMTHRNGYRSREWQTRAGTVELQIAKLRRGNYFPSFLEPRRRSEQALLGARDRPRRPRKAAAARSSRSTSARPRPRHSGPPSCAVYQAGAGRRPARDQRRPRRRKGAIAKVLGCSWQRCTVHFLRDCLGHARRNQHGLLAALIRPIFNADLQAQARDRLSEAVPASGSTHRLAVPSPSAGGSGGGGGGGGVAHPTVLVVPAASARLDALPAASNASNAIV
jgi:Transposase, Mutator family